MSVKRYRIYFTPDGKSYEPTSTTPKATLQAAEEEMLRLGTDDGEDGWYVAMDRLRRTPVLSVGSGRYAGQHSS